MKMKNAVTNKRLLPSGLNSQFLYQDLPYTTYIDKTRHMVENARLDLDHHHAHKIINANTPNQSKNEKPPRTGILLIHGLLDSPYGMQSLFDYYEKHNILVRSLLLPGHGTVPGDLLDVTYEAWLDATLYGINTLKKEVDDVVVVGYSTGAALGIYAALQGAPVDGLISFAPALKIKNRLAFTANWHHAISWFAEKAKWFHVAPDTDIAKYQSLPFNAIYQVYRLSCAIDKLQEEEVLTVPQFMVSTADDEVVDHEVAFQFFQKCKNPLSRFIAYDNHHDDALYGEDNRLILKPSHYPEAKILDFPHNCLAIAPDHEAYGKTSGYLDIQHYNTFWGRPFKKDILTPNAYYAGAANHFNLSHYPLKRLSYNPDFYPLMDAIDDFMQKVLKDKGVTFPS